MGYVVVNIYRFLINYHRDTAQQSGNQTTQHLKPRWQRSQYHLAVACGLAPSSVVRERFECVITDQPTRYRKVVLTLLPLRSEKLCQKNNILRTCYAEESQRFHIRPQLNDHYQYLLVRVAFVVKPPALMSPRWIMVRPMNDTSVGIPLILPAKLNFVARL